MEWLQIQIGNGSTMSDSHGMQSSQHYPALPQDWGPTSALFLFYNHSISLRNQHFPFQSHKFINIYPVLVLYAFESVCLYVCVCIHIYVYTHCINANFLKHSLRYWDINSHIIQSTHSNEQFNGFQCNCRVVQLSPHFHQFPKKILYSLAVIPLLPPHSLPPSPPSTHSPNNLVNFLSL